MPLTDAEVDKTFLDIEEAIRCRLRMSDIIPVEMADYRIGKMSSSENFGILIYI
jgi:mediator of RNA polymerase II transcription subunit 14